MNKISLIDLSIYTVILKDISKRIKHKDDKKILLRGERIGQNYAYRLNPYYAWRGDSKKGREWIGKIIQGGRE